MNDNVEHPAHYKAHASGVECIQITEHMNFCLGNAVKYIWRADEKGNAIEDLKKAAWYIEREIQRRQPESDEEPIISWSFADSAEPKITFTARGINNETFGVFMGEASASLPVDNEPPEGFGTFLSYSVPEDDLATPAGGERLMPWQDGFGGHLYDPDHHYDPGVTFEASPRCQECGEGLSLDPECPSAIFCSDECGIEYRNSLVEF